jgi:hypothetical protein
MQQAGVCSCHGNLADVVVYSSALLLCASVIWATVWILLRCVCLAGKTVRDMALEGMGYQVKSLLFS